MGRSQRLQKGRFPAAERRLWPAVVLQCPLGEGRAGPGRTGPAGSTGHAGPHALRPRPFCTVLRGVPPQTGSWQPAVQSQMMGPQQLAFTQHLLLDAGPPQPCCCSHSPDEETEAQPGSCHGQLPVSLSGAQGLLSSPHSPPGHPGPWPHLPPVTTHSGLHSSVLPEHPPPRWHHRSPGKPSLLPGGRARLRLVAP